MLSAKVIQRDLGTCTKGVFGAKVRSDLVATPRPIEVQIMVQYVKVVEAKHKVRLGILLGQELSSMEPSLISDGGCMP
jgi:hypothetical protein